MVRNVYCFEELEKILNYEKVIIFTVAQEYNLSNVITMNFLIYTGPKAHLYYK